MVEPTYSPVYIVKPDKGFASEINGEDFDNIRRGTTKRIKHPIKMISLADYPILEKRFERCESGTLISTRWGFFWEKDGVMESIAPNDARKDIYETFQFIFKHICDEVYDGKSASIESRV